MATEDIEGPSGNTVRVIVAPGRTVQTSDGTHSPGEAVKLAAADVPRLIRLGYVHMPGEVRKGGLPVDGMRTPLDPFAIGLVGSETR
jgi:hypothetical protein